MSVGEWTVRAEVQAVRKGTDCDASDCCGGVEPLRFRIIPKDAQMLYRTCESDGSGTAPATVRWRSNPALFTAELQEIVALEISEDGQMVPIDGEQIALSYGKGEVSLETRRSGTFVLTPLMKDGAEKRYAPGDSMQLPLEWKTVDPVGYGGGF